MVAFPFVRSRAPGPAFAKKIPAKRNVNRPKRRNSLGISAGERGAVNANETRCKFRDKIQRSQDAISKRS